MSIDVNDPTMYDYSQRQIRAPEPDDDQNESVPIPLAKGIELYERQQELRQFEKRAYDLFMQNLVKGTSHLSLGMEAVSAGFGAAMRHRHSLAMTHKGILFWDGY